MEHELLAANTIFQERTGEWTFRDRATGVLRQLDYILVRKQWRNSIMNAEPNSTFSSVSSDNRVVSIRVHLNLRVPKPSPKIWYGWKAFSSNRGIQTRYTEEVRRRFWQLDKGAQPAANTCVLLLRTRRRPNCVCLCLGGSEPTCNPKTQRW